MQALIFGPGRVGGAMAQYMRYLGHEADLVSRLDAGGDRVALERRIAAADWVGAAIPDGEIADWFDQWRGAIGERPAIHFSGALSIDGMRGYHPLYSFPKRPLAPATLEKVAIAREAGSPPFASLAPGAPNPELEISACDRAFYHALAVLSGNFAAHLWNETARAFAGRFDAAPAGIYAGYLAGVVDRFAESPFDSLTGPLARRDRASIEANLAALDTEPRLAALYRAFLSSAWPDYDKTRDD
jgi:hypothetical protein